MAYKISDKGVKCSSQFPKAQVYILKFVCCVRPMVQNPRVCNPRRQSKPTDTLLLKAGIALSSSVNVPYVSLHAWYKAVEHQQHWGLLLQQAWRDGLLYIGHKIMGWVLHICDFWQSRPWLRGTCLCMLAEISDTPQSSVFLSVSLSHTRIQYTPSLSGSVCVSVWVCACVYDKPHWWSNSRLAVFPDWVALDMHTSKALQVDVLALQRCNSLAWLTQNTLERGK